MDRRLLDVSYPVVELETAVVRLWRDFTHPGRALLIPLAEVREIHDLEAEDYFLLMAELRRLSRVLAGLLRQPGAMAALARHPAPPGRCAMAAERLGRAAGSLPGR
jgi:diadenosine tetraphosphate (Ap4A) HIT family hydrolase